MVFSQKLQNSEKNLLRKNLYNIASFTILFYNIVGGSFEE